VGLQAAAYLNGELVIDTWAGVADKRKGATVDGDSLFTVFSTSKGPTSTCIHILVERGKLYYDEPIAKYWPEFAAKGKGAVTVRMALTHRSAVPNNPACFEADQAAPWDQICAEIADMEPLYEPGTRTGYHGLTFGWILGELVRRVDGRPIARFLQEEVCGPLGLNAMYFGVPDSEMHRVGWLENVSGLQEGFNRPEVRQSSIPAGGGIMNARAIARMYACLANGGELDGVRILTSERLKIATTLQTDAVDDAFRIATRKALGYWLGGPGLGAGGVAGPQTFGFQGFGGSVGFADPERNFAFALTKNYMSRGGGAGGTSTAETVEQAVEAALGMAKVEAKT
jgi:CubicO group peptidase (beta-lactamase class C family)